MRPNRSCFCLCLSSAVTSPRTVCCLPHSYSHKDSPCAADDDVVRLRQVKGGQQVFGIMLRAYCRLLDRRPLTVKALTGGTLALTGDATAQYFEHRAIATKSDATAAHRSSESVFPAWYDQRRALAMTSLGTAYQGLVNHFLLNLLERAFPSALGVRSVLKKTFMTQLVANPLCYLPTFFGWTSLVRGLSLEQLESKVRNEYWAALRATWLIFTPSNLMIYWLVPVHHQASVVAVVGFLYQVSLSLIAGGGRGEATTTDDATVQGKPVLQGGTS